MKPGTAKQDGAAHVAAQDPICIGESLSVRVMQVLGSCRFRGSSWGLRPQGRGEHFGGREGKGFLDPFDRRAFPPGKGPSRDHADSMLSSDRCRGGGETGCRTGTNPERPTPFLKGGAQQEGQERDRSFFLEGRAWGLGAAARGATGQEESLLLEGEAEQGGAEGGTHGSGSACRAGGVHLEGRCSRSGLGLALPLKGSLSLQLFLFLGFLVLANYSFFVGCAHGQA